MPPREAEPRTQPQEPNTATIHDRDIRHSGRDSHSPSSCCQQLFALSQQPPQTSCPVSRIRLSAPLATSPPSPTTPTLPPDLPSPPSLPSLNPSAPSHQLVTKWVSPTGLPRMARSSARSHPSATTSSPTASSPPRRAATTSMSRTLARGRTGRSSCAS